MPNKVCFKKTGTESHSAFSSNFFHGQNVQIQGISLQRVISNSALVKVDILISADILDPTFSLVRPIYA